MSNVGDIKVVAGFVWWTGSTTFGQKELYSFKFDGEDEFYRQGTEQHEGVIEKGNFVKVEVEAKKSTKGVEYWEVKRAKIVDAPAEAVEAQEESKKKAAGAKKGDYVRKAQAKNDYWEQKDIYYKEVEVPAIRYANSRTLASQWVAFLLEQDAVAKIPAKTKKEERRKVLDGLLDFYTARFYNDALDQAAVGRVAEALEPQEDPIDAAVDAESGGSEFDDD